MAGRKKKITLGDGREVEGTVMGFKTGAEHWTEYFVDDGTVLWIKLVATEVLKLEGEFDALGDPQYVIASQNIMTVSAPDHLKRGVEDGS